MMFGGSWNIAGSANQTTARRWKMYSGAWKRVQGFGHRFLRWWWTRKQRIHPYRTLLTQVPREARRRVNYPPCPSHHRPR